MDIKQNQQSDPETNLEKFAINLNEQAKKNKLDPVIGREKEINRLIRILSRKNKNNPALIGEPGVGKTAVVEGLAQRIVKNDVPENLSDKIIYQLDLGLLVAGAKFHGEFEARLKGILQQIKKSQNTIILFIDELHLIVGTGRTQGSMDTSNLLKPMLARGELRCVGSTTLDEYRQYIEKDKALERRFQKILVQEPSEEETITILRGLRERFEVFHGVFIHDSALIAAAKLAQRYINDRFLPDKAIDLIDEACAFIKTQINSVPLELDDANRKIMQLQIEQAALAREKDITSKEKLKRIKEELAQAQEEQTKIKAKWESESTKVNLIKKLKTEIEHLKQELDNVPISGDFLRAGKIKYSILPEKIAELEVAQKAIKNNQLIKEDITEHEVADVVSQ